MIELTTDNDTAITDNTEIIVRRNGSESDEAVARQSKPKRTDNSLPHRRVDPYLWGIYITLLIFSVVELYSASISEVRADHIYGPLIVHVRFLVLGFFIVLGLQKIHYKYFRLLATPFALLCIGLILFSMFSGVRINGAQRAIAFAGITIQPAEIAKLSVVILLASILTKYQMEQGVKWQGIWRCAAWVMLFGGLLWTNGLTNMILLMVVSLSLFVIGGMQTRRFFIVLGIYVMFGGVLYAVKYNNDKPDKEQTSGRVDTHKGRISRWWDGVNPEDPIDDLNRQEIFAKFALAHGGIIGNGPGYSRESSRLPLAFSDYIYSIIIEDTGFIGGITLLLIYLLLIARAGWVAGRCSRAFPAFIIMGCAVLIVFQALVHMAIVTGVFPVSGQPLPFISKGGTSIVVMSAAIGMMMSVSRFAVTSDNWTDINKELHELSDDMQSANPMNLTN